METLTSVQVVVAILGTAGTLLATIAGVWAAVTVVRYKARYDALAASLELMAAANNELRAEAERDHERIDTLHAKVEILESETVRALIDRLSRDLALACPYRPKGA